MLRSLTTQAGAINEPEEGTPEERITDNGTAIIEAPKFDQMSPAEMPKSHRMAQAGSLDSTLASLTELVAQEQKKTVVLECMGLHLVPAQYQATIKKVAIQMIRNAVMHGVESTEERQNTGKPPHGTLHLEFKLMPDESFELYFQDDGRGLDPDQVRTVAVKKGVVTEEAAERLRDRQAIKLIFKSRFSTLEDRPGEAPHGTGMAMVRRYVQEAGGKIALASLLGHETRFKITLPPLVAIDAPLAAPATPAADEPPAAQVA
jgi:signal transduction histidine kinase